MKSKTSPQNLNNSSRLRDSRISNGNSATTLRNSRNRPERSRMNNGSSVITLRNSKNSDSRNRTSQIDTSNKSLRDNKISRDNSNNNARTTPRNGRSKPECTISRDNSVNSRTTELNNSGAQLRRTNNRLPGRTIARVAGSLSTAPGSNGGLQRLPSPR